MLRPYGVLDDDNAMKMIGHHHKGIQRHMGEMCGNIQPAFLDDFTPRIQPHLFMHDVAK